MKKYLKLILFTALIFILVGCNNNKDDIKETQKEVQDETNKELGNKKENEDAAQTENEVENETENEGPNVTNNEVLESGDQDQAILNQPRDGEEVIKLKSNIAGVDKVSYLYHRDGRVTRLLEETIFNLETSDITEENIEEAEKIFIEVFSKKKGHAFDINKQDEIVIFTGEIDFELADESDLIKVGFVNEDGSLISEPEKLLELLKSVGYTEVE